MLEVFSPPAEDAGAPPEGERLALEYGLAVLAGQVYENPVARLVHAPEGVYCEFKRPVRGAYLRLAPSLAEVLPERGARRVVWEAFSRRQAEPGELLVVYDEKTYYRWGAREVGRPRLEPPYLLFLEAPRSRWLLFYQGREFLFFRLSPGLPVLAGVRA